MRGILVGSLFGALLYFVATIRYWLPPGSAPMDEHIRLVARLGLWILGAAIGLLALDYFYREGRTSAMLLVTIGALGGFQLTAEIHWHLAVGRHRRRKK